MVISAGCSEAVYSRSEPIVCRADGSYAADVLYIILTCWS